ncbi:MAG: NAD(P)H-dependent oxidoreductase subunit E [Syntrophobacteraceae bacterium]|jgi:NADH-quinone oxidoreductase subunit E|nr:NAD(P)H-dependent oxidoreductase subunit E [Syntrophobacteraceae bacterium]
MEYRIEDVDGIINHWGPKPASLLQIMLDINHKYHYLPRESLDVVSVRLGMPISQVYGVANFFKVFSLTPRGRSIMHVCTGTACHVKGTPKLLDRLKQDLGLNPGDTTEDMALTLETVNCVGACASAPVVVIDGDTFAEVTPNRIGKLAKEALEKKEEV